MHIERRTLVKVPEVTAIFWIVKALTTGMGETTSDFFIHRVGLNNKAGLIVVVLIAGAILAVSLAAQLAADRYKAPLLVHRPDGRDHGDDGRRRGARGTRCALRRVDGVLLGGARAVVRRVVPG
jgi:hypothetical protein